VSLCVAERYAPGMAHLLTRIRSGFRRMFEPGVPQQGNPKNPAEARTDATSKMNVDAPTDYVKSYDEGRPPK
jgi:hypothetical protein